MACAAAGGVSGLASAVGVGRVCAVTEPVMPSGVALPLAHPSTLLRAAEGLYLAR